MVAAFLLYPEFAVAALIRLNLYLARGGRLKRIGLKLVRRHISKSWECYISPSAQIGRRLRLPHPIGIVIGDGAIIGDDVRIYQHVTIGSRCLSSPTYPSLGDGVLVGAGAKIIGGVSIGEKAKIGAGAIVVKDVHPHAVAISPAAVMHGAVEVSNLAENAASVSKRCF